MPQIIAQVAENHADGPFLCADERAFSQAFDQRSFLFAHRLAGHELFGLERLSELAKYLLATGDERTLRWQPHQAPVDSGWKISHSDFARVNDAILDLDNSASWVLLYSVQRHPEYRRLLNTLMQEIVSATGVSPDEVTWEDAYIFLASPGSVTPYHIDHEATFLFQIHGARKARIWNPRDRSVLTEQELETYYAGDFSAAKYRSEIAAKAEVHDLVAGTGVHHPCRAPHSYQNGDTYTVAMGIHFCIRKYDRQSGIYQINHYLRQCGLDPAPPGLYRWRDALKIGTVSLFANRHPKDKDELLRSGIRNMLYPVQLVRQLAGRR